MDPPGSIFPADLQRVVALDRAGQLAPRQIPHLGQGAVQPLGVVRQPPEQLRPAQGRAAVRVQTVVRMLEMGVHTVKIQLTHGRRAHIVVQHIARDDPGGLDHAVLRDRKVL